MADPASKFTDEELKKVEKQLKSVYSQAYLDILQKQNEFNRKYEEKSKKYLKKVANGEMTQAQYSDWLKGQVFQGDQWQAKKEQMINVIYNSNKTATNILNGKTKSVFAFNATYANYNLEHGAGVNFGFGIYDTNTVINLVKNNPKLLPEWKIDQAKDYRWSQKKLNKQVSLGIIEGESLDKIATRLCNNLCTTNFNKMRTFARTSMTGAQNEGRLFSYENAKELNIKVKKQWMCTLDDHTRITHQQLDGQIQETDKPFEVDGLKIMYPGDPNAEPALVFNCRCTMVADIEDYPATYDRYDNIDGRPIKQMTYEEWLDAKSKGSDILPVPLTFSHTEQMAAETKHIIIQGQDISTTWERRPDQFDFEIEDVINAQGFDGKPKVVSAEEFDKAVKAANNGNGFIAQRTYSAPDQETLDAYREQLYSGKWYVDCSTGGAQYGQGMYCAADYNGVLSDGIKSEMSHYVDLQDTRIGYSQSQAIIDAQYKYAEEQRQKILDTVQGDMEQAMLRREILHTGTAEDRKLLRALSDEEYDKMYDRLASVKEKADKAYRDATHLSKEEIAEMFNISEHAPNYVETITLDPSARIITYKELDSMRSYGNIQKKLIEEMDIESDQKSILKKVLVEDEEDSSVIENETIKKLGERIEKRADQLMEMDPGSFAAALGYDAINAERHGQSGSYTVILNRTKLIIKEP